MRMKFGDVRAVAEVLIRMGGLVPTEALASRLVMPTQVEDNRTFSRRPIDKNINLFKHPMSLGLDMTIPLHNIANLRHYLCPHDRIYKHANFRSLQ